MKSIENKIEKAIKSKQKGVLLFADDFIAYGSSKSIQKALERQDKEVKGICQLITLCSQSQVLGIRSISGK